MRLAHSSLVLLIVTGLVKPVQASSRGDLVRQVLLRARPPVEAVEDPGLAGFELPFEGRLGLYVSAATTISFVELGDKSPLKAKIGENAWNQLKERLPLLQQAAATLMPGLVADLRAELDRPSLDRQLAVTTAAGALLLPALDESDLFLKGTYIFGAKALAGLALHPTAFTRLTRLAVDPATPPDLKQTAGGLVTASGALKAQLYVEEARYRFEVGADADEEERSAADLALMDRVLLFP